MSRPDTHKIATYTQRLEKNLSGPRPMPGNLPETFRELWDLGEAGKLWTLEVLYTLHGDPEVKRKLLRNLPEATLAATRVKMFSQGLAFEADGDPGHYRIIIPMDIISVDLYQQFGYFSG